MEAARDPQDPRLVELMGELSLQDPDQRLITLTAEPGTPSHDRLRILAFWAAKSAGHSAADHRTPRPCPAGLHAVTLAMNPARFATVRWIFSSRVSDSWSRAPTPASFLPRTYSGQARSLHM